MNILDNIFGMNNSDYVKSQFGIRFNILETVIYSIGNGIFMAMIQKRQDWK